MSQHYTLTLTKEQLMVIDRACDVLSRLMAGQFDVIVQDCMDYNPRPEAESDQAYYGRRAKLSAYLRVCEPLFTNLPPNVLFSIGGEEMGDSARVAYDVMKVIRYQQHLESGNAPGGNVYAYPPRQMSREPLPTLVREETHGKAD